MPATEMAFQKALADQRNIEIKARIGTDAEFERCVEIAREITGSNGTLIKQRDVFFNSQCGRLKLRYLDAPARSQLVYYDRPDEAGPKLSKFNLISVEEPEVLEKMLTLSNGARGELVKQRLLFIYNQTRIHLDKVEQLGNFLEFEVILQSHETTGDGQAVAEKLMEMFNIKEKNLMKGAYFDELQKNA